MAGYSIVLNLTGNAVRSANALSTALTSANTAASALKVNLQAVSASLSTINTTPVATLNANLARARYNATMLARQNIGRLVAASNVAPRTTYVPTRGRYASNPNQTRHTATRIASYGYGFNIGGFSGRLSSIFQPDANGQLFGLNAASLAKNINIAAIAANIVASIGKAILKVTAVSTLAPIAIGGLGIGAALKALKSESFAEGVRLISRRHQAQLGLGAEYLQANQNSDFLAASYGLDRSTTLSSINVLTGLGVGGSSRKLTLNEATGLTKVGGLISQHHGVPFERVMTNIQQLLVQDKPHIRDIRELLNQAPILGKYALKELEQKGIVGVDVRTYLKDQKNILSVLKQYELDIASNQGMQARGRIALAQQDLWAKIAGNGDFWGYVGNAGSGIINSWGTGVNNLLTMLTGNQEFKVMVKQIELIFDNFGKKGVTLIDKLIALVDGIAARYGVDLGDKNKAAWEVDKDETIKAALRNPELIKQIREAWEKSGLPVSTDVTNRNKEFDNFLNSGLRTYLQDAEWIRNNIIGQGKQLDRASNYGWFDQWFDVAADRAAMRNATLASKGVVQAPWLYTTYNPQIRNWSEPSSAFNQYTLANSKVLEGVGQYINELSRIGTLDPSQFSTNGQGVGDDLTGMNRDRKALEIHFNAPLVEWNNTINATNPQETYAVISEEFEQLVAAGVQKALLGSSGKLESRWY